ncbi:ABC transporter substrate-binding protein [Candidatus Collierbacteria bacterium]|nr:ABC transporter substrate-binding protein [Candidatus Collierbacteria bacterium]
MTKIIRRQFWLISAFFKKYYQIVIGSLIFSLLAGFIGVRLVKLLPQPKPVIRVAVIGQYTNQSLPPLVKNILNSGLTKVGPKSNIIGNLASKWEIENDDKTYAFTLKPDITWSDGDSIKAADIVFNIPNVKTETKGNDQLVFHLPDSFSPFPSVLTNPVTNKKGLTAGNFKVSLSQNTNGLISKIELSSDKQQIVVKVYGSSNQALTAYKLGEVDAIFNYPLHEEGTLQKYGTIQSLDNFNQALVLFINTQNPILKDKSIRQGIAYAIKDKSFSFSRSLTPISIDSWAYNPLVKTYDYDQVRAIKLIRDNLPDRGQVLSLELATMPQFLDTAEKIKEEIDSNLINLNIKVVTSRPEDYQLYLTLFEIPPDPDQYIFWHSTQGTNISHINSEKIDKSLEDGRRTIDQQERKKIYNEFQRTFAEELPAIFLHYPRYLNLARSQAIFDIINPETAL